MKKLTDEELSLLLSQQAAGKLCHSTWRAGDCGCIAGTVLDAPDMACISDGTIDPSAMDISNAITEASGKKWACDVEYPSTPEAMLDLIAKAGL